MGPAKIRNPNISVLYIFYEVKFKFKCLQLKYVNLGMIYLIPNEIGSSLVDICR